MNDTEDKLVDKVTNVLKKLENYDKKFEELTKKENDKKSIVNIPATSLDILRDDKKTFDDDAVIESLEKMRDYITFESKKVKDDMFKLSLQFESKVNQKIDKKDLEDIESKLKIKNWL